MSRETIHRCDRCMVVFDPFGLPREKPHRVMSLSLDGEMDLCGDCLTDLDAWVRAPLEPDDAIDHTTGQRA